MTEREAELPPLPYSVPGKFYTDEHGWVSRAVVFTAEQMHAYGRAAIQGAQVSKDAEDAPLPPKEGDYVLATKYSDGDPGDPWALGFYAGIEFGDRHMVRNNEGGTIRANGYRNVGRITPEIGNWLWNNRDLLESAPSKINLWKMYDWVFVNEKVIELDRAAMAPSGETS